MSGSTSFSCDGEEVISRQVGVSPGRAKTQTDLEKYYETEKCRKFIVDSQFQRVALQFPDPLLCDAPGVVAILTKCTSAELFILGDTSYGSCCVDEIAAEHNGADCIIHFGPSCLTRTSRLPVLFVFGREEVEVRECEAAFRQAFQSTEDHVLVLYDTVYVHCVDEFMESIADYTNCIASQLRLPAHDTTSRSRDLVSPPAVTTCGCQQTCGGPCSQQAEDRHVVCDTGVSVPVRGVEGEERSSAGVEREEGVSRAVSPGEMESSLPSFCYNKFGRHFQLKCGVENYKIFYIGVEGPTLTNLILNYSKCQFYNYNPQSKECRQESLSVNRALRRRYFLVQKAKEARTVGILVGTLGAANYLEIMERLKKILKQCGKKYYTVAVGKLNVPKMANFLEIDVIVLVACPENSLVDSQEFYKPVVTPYEMEIACLRSKEWTGDYSTDYQDLLPGALYHTHLEEGAEEAEPEFSLISGGFVPNKETSQLEGDDHTSLVLRPKLDVAIHGAAGVFLQERSWQGLEQKLGQNDVGMATDGRSGLAAAYKNEPVQKT